MRRKRGEGGYASLEFALTLPAVLTVLALCLAVMAGAVGQLRAQDAARAGAREASIGSSDGRIAAVISQLAGPSARVDVGHRDGLIVVAVAVPLPVLGEWGDFSARAEAVAVPEN